MGCRTAWNAGATRPRPARRPAPWRSCDLDTDGDGTPDLFDTDNDNDGVIDRKDDSPFVAITGLAEARPLKLTLNGLAAGKSTAVNFQLRPANDKQLWYAFNVLDWPYDQAAQVQDVDGKTYADVAKALGRVPQANESNGDVKILPMLELRVPGTAANLPSSDELTPYGVTVGDYTADGSTKLVYVPLSVQTDDKTGGAGRLHRADALPADGQLGQPARGAAGLGGPGAVGHPVRSRRRQRRRAGLRQRQLLPQRPPAGPDLLHGLDADGAGGP